MSMANISMAVKMVVEFIQENELYSFQSLAEDTQEKLLDTYGSSFESKVNSCLNLA